ncbi:MULTISPECIES: LLM class flavin-dependent oxidoreductase [unclassified Streptomyces]|uniref:LLM class flavin-dependent oxidoreductase n=1 Tax=unclassified Streptomyces TaxID=2593676 RepID=UPI0009A4A680|nr:LLM class flavin-dependent oxidoreductase [Streptomyces sp. 3211]
MDFSLFYFADSSSDPDDAYRLLLEGAKFADAHGFSAVWTPERHFHSFGGLYPNPAVTSAAIATVTSHISIRAGSVVAPLHHPVRIAEEWSVVDNLSHGRAGISLAPGWNNSDFVLRPDNYHQRREVLVSTLDTVRRLWRGEKIALPDGDGRLTPVQIHPKPVQQELPVWITSAGNLQTFQLAGRLGTGVLTHLLGQTLEDLTDKIGVYRAAHHAHHGSSGHVAIMLHTFLGQDAESVAEIVRGPFSAYLRSSLNLITHAARDLLPGIDPSTLDPDDLDFLVQQSFDRYFRTGGLFGSVSDGLATLDRLAETDIDEVACLVDFVPGTDAVLGSLKYLDELKDSWSARR